MEVRNRRKFLKQCSLTAIPLLLPHLDVEASNQRLKKVANFNTINFIYDGLDFSPQEYLEKLSEINNSRQIERDFYGYEGTTKILEIEFGKLTGKEKAIYLPTGTMANQLAITLLSEGKTKIIVPENSHIFRDEADASQSVHNKRLVPIGEGRSHFELADLKRTIEYLDKNEVFKSGLGTVVIENPIRRANGAFVPIHTIREISNYCKQNGIKLHLDGARIHLASSITNISVKEYASYFDSIYISLYKYLNAAGGAILCGDSKMIDQVPHQIKIHGGTVYQNWTNTAMALYYLNGIEQRWDRVTEYSKKLRQELNKIKGTFLTATINGTNIYHLTLDTEINLERFTSVLRSEHSISLGHADKNGIIKFVVNESLLRRDINDIIDAWRQAIEKAK